MKRENLQFHHVVNTIPKLIGTSRIYYYSTFCLSSMIVILEFGETMINTLFLEISLNKSKEITTLPIASNLKSLE